MYTMPAGHWRSPGTQVTDRCWTRSNTDGQVLTRRRDDGSCRCACSLRKELCRMAAGCRGPWRKTPGCGGRDGQRRREIAMDTRASQCLTQPGGRVGFGLSRHPTLDRSSPRLGATSAQRGSSPHHDERHEEQLTIAWCGPARVRVSSDSLQRCRIVHQVGLQSNIEAGNAGK